MANPPNDFSPEFSMFKTFNSPRRDLNAIFFQRIKVKNANDVFFAVHLQIPIAPLCDRHDIENEKCAPFERDNFCRPPLAMVKSIDKSNVTWWPAQVCRARYHSLLAFMISIAAFLLDFGQNDFKASRRLGEFHRSRFQWSRLFTSRSVQRVKAGSTELACHTIFVISTHDDILDRG